MMIMFCKLWISKKKKRSTLICKQMKLIKRKVKYLKWNVLLFYHRTKWVRMLRRQWIWLMGNMILCSVHNTQQYKQVSRRTITLCLPNSLLKKSQIMEANNFLRKTFHSIIQVLKNKKKIKKVKPTISTIRIQRCHRIPKEVVHYQS